MIGDYISDNQIKLDGDLYDTDRIQTVSHVLQTGGPGLNYTHQQLKFAEGLSIIFSIVARVQKECYGGGGKPSCTL